MVVSCLPLVGIDQYKLSYQSMEGRALLLNASFQPLQVISWQKAIQLFFSGKVEVVESSDHMVRSVSISIRMPIVIRLLTYFNPLQRKHVIRLNRNHVFLRDHHTCQYCGKKHPYSQLTLDHVIPVVKGGKKTWENITTACRSCNIKKGLAITQPLCFFPGQHRVGLVIHLN